MNYWLNQFECWSNSIELRPLVAPDQIPNPIGLWVLPNLHQTVNPASLLLDPIRSFIFIYIYIYI